MCKGIDHEPRKIGGPADCLKSPLLCVSGISGSERKRRVEGIMMNRSAHDLNFGKRLLLAIAGFTAVALPRRISYSDGSRSATRRPLGIRCW